MIFLHTCLEVIGIISKSPFRITLRRQRIERRPRDREIRLIVPTTRPWILLCFVEHYLEQKFIYAKKIMTRFLFPLFSLHWSRVWPQRI